MLSIKNLKASVSAEKGGAEILKGISLEVKPGEVLAADLLGEPAERYDAILIDCAPSLGVLTINGLTAPAPFSRNA